jgi:hypothetical protein
MSQIGLIAVWRMDYPTITDLVIAPSQRGVVPERLPGEPVPRIADGERSGYSW